MLSFPPFRLDPGDERLWRDEQEIPLRRKPFAILRYFVEHPQRLVTHDELVQAVWGQVAMSESLLRTYIRELRRNLGEGIVETVVGRGYRFIAEVSQIESAPAQRASAAPQPTLVGRTDAMNVLWDAWRGALDGTRRIVFVTGDSGIGKSALAEAFVLEIAQQDTPWIARGACIEHYGAGEPYLPMLAALGSVARGPIGARLVEVLARHAPSWLAQMPALRADPRVETPQTPGEGPTQTRMARELAEAFEVLTQELPIVVLLEDLQWADDCTAELLAMLGRRYEPARLLILGTVRDAEMAKGDPMARVMGELEAHGRATVLRLEGLPESAVAEYLVHRYAAHGFPPELASRICEPTGGNPLFVVGLLGDLERRQVLKRIDGRWQLTLSLQEVAAHRPDTVTRLIDIQIDRLSDREQRVLEAAAAAGATFTASVIASALDLDADLVDATCEALAKTRHFLHAMGTETWPDGTVQYCYGFVHAMFQHAALTRSSSASIRLWHRRIGERLETGYAADTDPIAAELAVHFDACHQYPKATAYYVDAGERAARRFGLSSALRHFARARELVSRLPTGDERDVLELRVLRNVAPVSLVAQWDAHHELVPTLVRAAELATRLRDDRSLATVLSALQTCHLRSGELDEVAKTAHEAREVASRLGDAALLTEAAGWESAVSFHAGRLLEARDRLDELESTFERERLDGRGTRSEILQHPEVTARWRRAAIAWMLGYPDDALARARSALSLAQSFGDTNSTANAWLALVLLHILCRRAESARESLRGFMGLAGQSLQHGDGSIAYSVMSPAAILSYWIKTTLGENADPPDDKLNLAAAGWVGPFFTIPFAEACFRMGQKERAMQEVSTALATAEAKNLRMCEPELLRLRGEFLVSTDRKEAERCFARALVLAQSQSSRSFALRAAMSLYRSQRGKSATKTLEKLRRLYESFTEGFDTLDLLDAKAILDAAPRKN